MSEKKTLQHMTDRFENDIGDITSDPVFGIVFNPVTEEYNLIGDWDFAERGNPKMGFPRLEVGYLIKGKDYSLTIDWGEEDNEE